MNGVYTHVVRLNVHSKKLDYYTGNYDAYVAERKVRDEDAIDGGGVGDEAEALSLRCATRTSSASTTRSSATSPRLKISSRG